jgi:elongation factor G
MTDWQDDVRKIRNLGIVAHVDAGKTTTTERILFYSGVSSAMGEVDDGTATTDFLPEEQARGISITSAVTTCAWAGHRINLVDTPGHVDFSIEVERSIRVVDGAIVILDATAGVQPQTEATWAQAGRHGVARIVYLNKMDRVGADVDACVASLRSRLGGRPLLVQLPIFEADAFVGVVDLVSELELVWDGATLGATYEERPIRASLAQIARDAREQLVTELADDDAALLGAYVEGSLTVDALREAVARACRGRRAQPVLLGAALRNRGVQPLLDAVVDYLPSPLDARAPVAHDAETGAALQVDLSPDAPVAALAFKVVTDPEVGTLTFLRVYAGTLRANSVLLDATRGHRERIGRIVQIHASDRHDVELCTSGNIVGAVGLKNVFTGDTLCSPGRRVVLEPIDVPEPVLTVRIEPRTAADQERLPGALALLAMEDPSFVVRHDAETDGTLIAGMGELHLQILVERLRRQHGVEVTLGRPTVAYRETATESARGEGVFQRTMGPKGLFGHVALELEPTSRGHGFSVSAKLAAVDVPRELVAPAEEGIREAARAGVLAGYPVTDVHVTVVGGSHHPVDSAPAAFKIAGSLAFRDAFIKAKPTLLEPVMHLEVLTPDEHVGDVTNDLGARRAKISGMDLRSGVQVVSAEVPLATTFGYATDLRSRTQGRATFSMRFGYLSPVPPQVAAGVLARAEGRA